MKKDNTITVGSVCSGIEAASVAWEPLGASFCWFSEIADFPSRVLKEKYPNVENLGDMTLIPQKILNNEIVAPSVICGGTPCQAFSFAGWKKGLEDDRGNLTLRFVDIIAANDSIREKSGKNKTIVFWENVEGVLSDKTNAFGCFVSSLAGLDEPIESKKWAPAGLIEGPERNVCWRVLDAKYFGVPQQRKRLYVIAGGKDFHPETVLFEVHSKKSFKEVFPSYDLQFTKDGCSFEVFREYTDCVYSAYGTKWNGNAAATNGSLFVVQNERIRRLSPLECERLMGFPDNYTNLPKTKKTNRYQAVGNSWVIPVVKWIGERLFSNSNLSPLFSSLSFEYTDYCHQIDGQTKLYLLGKALAELPNGVVINATNIPEKATFSTMKDIVSPDAPEDIYISPVGCYGIIRRKRERNLTINKRLEQILLRISSEMSLDEIEKRSLVQHRGRFGSPSQTGSNSESSEQLELFQ